MIGLYFTFILALGFVGATPVPQTMRPTMSQEAVQKFLQNFGYMTADNPTASDITEGMLAMQRFYGLEETGEMDPDTMDDMSRPRCGVADIDPTEVPANCVPGEQGAACRRRRFSTLGLPWDSTSLTYRFNSYTPDLPRSVVQSAIERAFGLWAEVSPLKFTRQPDGNDPQSETNIEVIFGSRTHHPSPFDGAFDGSSRLGGTVLAHAFNPGTVLSHDLRGDMHFDEDELWEDAAGIDLFTVAAHEFGHSIGLGHSDIRGALMFPTYYGYDPNFRLHQDDILGIQSLYGPAPITQPALIPTQPAPMTTMKMPTQPMSTRKSSTLPALIPTQPAPTTPMKMPTQPMSTRKSSTSTPMSTTTESVVLDICNTDYDTVATLDSVYDEITTIAIRDQTVLRIATDENMIMGVYYARESTFGALWEDNSDPISALLEKEDGTLVVIRGGQYWEYVHDGQNNFQLQPLFPKRLTLLGVPENNEIMAALSIREEGQIFLFSQNLYWTFDENFELTTPSLIGDGWRGVPNGIDAAFQWQGNSYFVKGNDYWRYNTTISEVDAVFLDQFNTNWLDCLPPAGSRASISQSYSGSLLVTCYCLLVLLLTNQISHL